MTLKRVQVVMLPTNEKAKLSLINNKLLVSSFVDWESKPKDWEEGDGLNQHLYILSDDEIREGDCCYDNGTIYKIKDKKHLLVVLNFGNAKKIIATTDEALCYHNPEYDSRSKTGREFIFLPQPSEDFIRVYVEAYNKNDIIKYVDVEYERMYLRAGTAKHLDSYEPKVNSKNEISIRKIKDTWTRDEVIALIKEFDNSIRTVREDEISYRNKWIEQNL